MSPSLAPPQAAIITEALRAMADCAPQLARIAAAQELAAYAAALDALVAYRAHLATRLPDDGSRPVYAEQAPDLTARAVLDSSIRTLGRRLAIRATVGYAVDDKADEQPAAPPSAATRQRAHRDRQRARKDGAP